MLLFFIAPHSRASHMAVANLSYRCMSGLTYEIRIDYYRECGGGGIPNWIDFCYISASCSTTSFGTTHPDTGYNVIVPFFCSANTTCFGGSVKAVEHYIFRDTITLPKQCDDWLFGWTLCCRGSDITTILNPVDDVLQWATLDNLNASCNSSPTFKNPPQVVVCTNMPIRYDFSATDVDGDSLVYSFDTARTAGNCLGKPFAVSYISPYDFDMPLSSSPPLSLNSTTGMITMSPTTAGEITVMVLVVEEYRNGQRIGHMTREVKVWVLNCNGFNPVAAFTSTTNGLIANFTTTTNGVTSWFWDFGDGNTSTLEDPNHAYTSQGNYNVCLRTTNVCGIDSICQNVFICGVLAGSTMSDSMICQYDTVSFTNSSTGATSYQWFKNSTLFSTLQHPDYVFDSAGVFQIIMIADSGTCQDTSYSSVEVTRVPLTFFNADPVCEGETSIFINTSSSFHGISAWLWDFDDGNTSTFQNTTHAYSNAGIYNVKLTLTDTNGCSSTHISQVDVDTMPVTNFGFTKNGLQVTFIDSSFYSENWSWDFGDGGNSTLQNPSHIYVSAGTYNVCLKVTKSTGCADSICKSLDVSVGIRDNVQENLIRIYPSIVGDHLFIEVRGIHSVDIKVQINNVIGGVVYGQDFEMMGSGAKLSIDLSGISGGVYFVRVKVGEKVVSRRVLKFSY